MKRFGYGFEFGIDRHAGSASGGGGPVGLPVWDSEHTSTGVTISPDTLTITSADDTGGSARGRVSHNSGLYYLEYVVHYEGTQDDANIYVGVGRGAPSYSDYDPAEFNTFNAILSACHTIHLSGSMNGAEGAVNPDTGLLINDGDTVSVFVDDTAGKIWFDLGDDATLADREAGTNPHYNITPNSLLHPAAAAKCLMADPDVASVTLLASTGDKGRFAPWGVTL